MEGRPNQTSKEKKREKWGERLYRSLLDWNGVIFCLVKSFRASSKG